MATTKPTLKTINVAADNDPRSFSYGNVCVTPVWSDVDRPDSDVYVVPNMRLARRFEKAILSGKIYSRPPVVMTDKLGKTFVSAHFSVMMRTLNADLKRAGF